MLRGAHGSEIALRLLKWSSRNKADEPSVDDIVVFGEDGLGRGSYQKGRILKRFHGKDRVARSSRGIMSDKSDSSL